MLSDDACIEFVSKKYICITRPFFYKLAGERLELRGQKINFLTLVQEGGVEIFGFSNLANIWCLARFAGFLQFCLWFSVFVNNDGGFSDSFVQCILRFYGFCQGSYTPQSC